MTTSRYANVPDAATVARRLGAVGKGPNDWRLADCGCSGQQIDREPGVNPALSISDTADGLRAYCHKCGNPALDAVCSALGIEPADRRTKTVNPYSESEGWRTVATYRHSSTGNARHVYRRDTPEGKVVRHQRGGSLAGYLPLSWTPPDPAQDIPPVWVDGEKTARAVEAAGALAISTIGGHANAVKAAWPPAGDGARMLVLPDNTTQELSAAETLGRHLAGLGYAVGILRPVGQAGTGADAADLPDGATILAHLRSEPTRWVYPFKLPDAGAGVVMTGATFRNDETGFEAAIAALGFEIRENVRASRLEWRRTDMSEDATREWARSVNANPDKAGWFVGGDNFEAWLRRLIAHRLRTTGGNPLRFSDERWKDCILATVFTRWSDPVADWLDGLPKWDGVERLDGLFTKALAAEDTPLNRNAASGFLIGAVARTREPGCIHDWMPVLVGRQGCGKSSFCLYLLPSNTRLDWYSDSVNLEDSEQKQVEQAGNSLIVENSEMRGAMTAKRDALKSHVTRRKTNFRKPYGRSTSEVLRCSVNIGTANDTGMGVLPYDPTGYRRYVAVNVSCDCVTPLTEPCHCSRPARMREYLDEIRLQLWAEAVARYDAADDKDRVHLIDRRLMQVQSEVNRSYVVENDALNDLIGTLLSDDSGQPIAELMYRVGWITSPSEGTDRRKQNEFAQALKAAGWHKIRAAINGRQAMRWYAPEPELLPRRCVQCGGVNDARPLTPDGLCIRCAVEMGGQVRRQGRVAPAAAVKSLANTSLGEMAAVRASVSPMDAERAAVVLAVLTNRLEQVAQAVADGATMGSETPDQLVNRALPQWWGLVSELAAEGFDAKSEEESDGHRDG